jgi:DNA ligase (NAD+)
MFGSTIFLRNAVTKKKIQELAKTIKKFQKEYYIDSKPSITDLQFDKLFRELQDLETKYPQYASKTSPTQKVAVKSSKENVGHGTKMLSLSNAFSKDDLIKFEKSIFKATTWKSDFYVCETKFDGIAVDVVYEGRKLKHVVTRGDGVMGQNITENVLKYIPNFIQSVPDDMNIRGEIVMSKTEFAKVSTEYSNSRNVVSGLLLAIKQRNDVVLEFIAYQVIGSTFPTQFQSLQELKKLNFAIDDQCRKVDTLDDVMKYIKEVELKRSQLPFEIDGVVIKLNHLADQAVLGENNRAPRWAMAYKFQGEKFITKLLEIQYQVSRLKKITPVGILEPILIQGATISRVSLYNFDFLQKNGIQAGDRVCIE